MIGSWRPSRRRKRLSAEIEARVRLELAERAALTAPDWRTAWLRMASEVIAGRLGSGEQPVWLLVTTEAPGGVKVSWAMSPGDLGPSVDVQAVDVPDTPGGLLGEDG